MCLKSFWKWVECDISDAIQTRPNIFSKNGCAIHYANDCNEMVRDQFLTPMGMLYALIVKHESIVEQRDLPISKKPSWNGDLLKSKG